MIRTITLPRERILPVAMVAATCAAAGIAATMRAPATPLVAVAAALTLLSLNWRIGVIVLLLTLPFAGVPVFLAGSSGLAARDLLIVAPLYLGFAVEMTRRHDVLLPPMGIALPALGLFAALVLVYVPLAPTPVAGAIGVRVWLAYLPMVAVGYVFVRRLGDAETVMKITALAALAPATIAIAEAMLAAHGGDFGPFESMYGSVQIDDPGRFVVLTTGGEGHIRIPRVRSTFTSVSQYAGFALVAFTCAVSMAMRRRNAAWAACAAFLGAAAFASGARATYVMVPAIAVIALLGDDARPRRIALLLTTGAIAVACIALLGSDLLAIARELPAHANVTLHTAWNEMRASIEIFGHGTGWDTNAALRYGGAAETRYIENWYAKAALELGLPGLMALAVALASIITVLFRGVARAHAQTRSIVAPIAALVLVMAVASFKGPYIDLDPLNVYFWLLIGVAAGALRRGDDTAPDLGEQR